MEAITYPLIPLRGICIFPHISVPFDVGREKSLAALSDVMGRDQYVAVSYTHLDVYKRQGLWHWRGSGHGPYGKAAYGAQRFL